MTVALQLEDIGSDTRVLLVPRQGQSFARVGVVAETSYRGPRSDRSAAVSLHALHRGVPGAAEADKEGVLRVAVDERPDQVPPAHLRISKQRVLLVKPPFTRNYCQLSKRLCQTPAFQTSPNFHYRNHPMP